MTAPSAHDRADLDARLRLLSLAGMGPARLRWLLSANEPESAVETLRAGRLPVGLPPAPPGVGAELVTSWAGALRRPAPVAVADCLRAGIEVLGPDDERWPFVSDPEPPALLEAKQRLDLSLHVPGRLKDARGFTVEVDEDRVGKGLEEERHPRRVKR